MKIIFLDIDGVLNSTTSDIVRNHLKNNEEMNYVAKENFDLLKVLVDESKSHIVISSTWRKDSYFLENACGEENIVKKFQDFFSSQGWGNAPIIGITPNLSGFRGEEVATYLDKISKVEIIEDYIVLDDDSDFILTELKDLDLIKLDRMKIYSTQDMNQKSSYWSNQNFYHIDRNTGLTLRNVYDVLKIFDKDNHLVTNLKEILNWKKI